MKHSSGPSSSFELEVFYDGLCRLCSAEIEHYRRKDTAKRVRWVDIAAADFDASKEGLDAREIHEKMHARWSESRELAIGVDAFLAIWKVVPGFGVMRRFVGVRAFRPIFELGYRAFAKARPYLPRRTAVVCDDDRCTVKI